MALNVGREVAALQRLGVAELRARYAGVFGEPTTSGNKPWLVKGIAWRLQANAEGGLSDQARQRAAELAAGADLRLTPPREREGTGSANSDHTLPAARDPRLPPAGSVLTRRYKGGEVRVRVLAGGFEYEGAVYPSLSAVAKAVTGSHCNGFLFFRLTKGAKA